MRCAPIIVCLGLLFSTSCNRNANEAPPAKGGSASAAVDSPAHADEAAPVHPSDHHAAHGQSAPHGHTAHPGHLSHEAAHGQSGDGHHAAQGHHSHQDKHAAHSVPSSHDPHVDHAADGTDKTADAELTAAEIFERRMLPIMRSGKGSSCTECHFGGVELSGYIRGDQAATFAALRDEGLIDVNRPDNSKILQFIARHTDKPNPLLAKVRQAEHEAFHLWIRAAVKEPDLLAAKSTNRPVGTELPVEVIRHMRRDRVLASFVENIWSEMGRCINCHSPERNQRQVREHGEQVSWIVPRNPAATLEKLVDGGNIELGEPGESSVLLKPLGLEKHGGGPKFAVGSRTDKNFRRFLTDYAAVVHGEYKKSEQLPEPAKEIAALTGQHLRIVDLPRELDKKLLRADIYRWTGEGWSETPWGTAENPINGKKSMWQSMVFFVAPRNSQRAEQLRPQREVRLPDGRYLVKIYVDRQDKTKQNRDYEMADAELYGQVEFEGDWRPGYQPPKIIHLPAER